MRPPATPQSDGALAARIVAAAREWVGTPYHHQASLKGHGTDCLGLIRGVYREVYGHEPESPPPYCAHWAEVNLEEKMADTAGRHLDRVETDMFDESDLLLFRWRAGSPAKHAGIATSRATMIHAQSGAAVCEIHLSSWWLRRLAFVFRFRESA